jgi:hypothetical protein
MFSFYKRFAALLVAFVGVSGVACAQGYVGPAAAFSGYHLDVGAAHQDVDLSGEVRFADRVAAAGFGASETVGVVGLGWRAAVGPRTVVGVSVLHEGASQGGRTYTGSVGGSVSVSAQESVDIEDATQLRFTVGHAFQDVPALIYAAVGGGRQDMTLSRTTTVRESTIVEGCTPETPQFCYNTDRALTESVPPPGFTETVTRERRSLDLEFVEFTVGAEYQVSAGGQGFPRSSLFAEVSHRDHQELKATWDTASGRSTYDADTTIARIGVRVQF